MLSKYSSNVILTKVRAMYGKRITTDDYKNLMNCKSVTQIATYLKNNTDYATVLGSVDESTIHRGHLESIVKTKLFYDIEKLLRFEISTGNSFSKYIIARTEIGSIVTALSLLDSKKADEYGTSIPMYFNNRTRINLPALSVAKDFDEFLFALGKSHYRGLLEKYRPEKGEGIDIQAVECELYNYLYETFLSGLEKTAGKSVKEELWSIVSNYIDFGNFARILRSNRINTGDTERSIIVEHGTLKQKYIDAMLEAKSEKEVFEIMESTSKGKRLKKAVYNYVDEIPSRMVYDKCRRSIRMSINPSIVMLSYIFLMQIELSNIVTIIEGVRYSLPQSEIEKLLTLKVAK